MRRTGAFAGASLCIVAASALFTGGLIGLSQCTDGGALGGAALLGLCCAVMAVASRLACVYRDDDGGPGADAGKDERDLWLSRKG